MSNATYYKWKSKYGGMEASVIERMKDLEAENRRLKQMVADLSLENMALKDIIDKKMLRPVQRKQLVTHMISGVELSVRKACAALGVGQSYYAYKPHPRGQGISLEPEPPPPSLSPSPARMTTQAKPPGPGRTAKRPPEGLGLAPAAVCVTLAEKTAGGEETVPPNLARRFCGVIWWGISTG